MNCTQKPPVNGIDPQMVRGVIASLGFPADRVERAVALLLNEKTEPARSDISCLLSYSDVQHTLAVSKSTLRRIIIDGKLKPVRITQRRIGFLADEVRAFIESLMHVASLSKNPSKNISNP